MPSTLRILLFLALGSLTALGAAAPKDFRRLDTRRMHPRDRQAIANANQLLGCIIRAHRRALETQGTNVDPGQISILLGTQDPQFPLPQALFQKVNPWAGVEAAPSQAFNSWILVCTSDAAHLDSVPPSSQALGLVEGYYGPRIPELNSPAIAGVSVTLGRPFLDPVLGFTRTYRCFVPIDESANDERARRLALRIHRQLKAHHQAVQSKADAEAFNSAAAFQGSLYLKGHPGSPDFFAAQEGRPSWLRCHPVIQEEKSWDGSSTLVNVDSRNLWVIHNGYLPETAATPATLITAVYLLHPRKDPTGLESHVFIQRSALR